jgi:3-deoxy-D-manno-octulosonate 8-phosphate phosphatase (KDO 8-P phosphatase)
MEIFDKLRAIKAFVFDVDGVLTDNTVHVWENGDQTRTMNIRDGFALKRAVDSGYKVCIITGGGSKGVISRLNGLGITDIFSKVSNKVESMASYMEANSLDKEEILYMGDDIMDLTVMNSAGVAVAPFDAVPEILDIAHIISTKEGGRGCVREIIEQTMKLQNTWAGIHEGEVTGV